MLSKLRINNNVINFKTNCKFRELSFESNLRQVRHLSYHAVFLFQQGEGASDRFSDSPCYDPGTSGGESATVDNFRALLVGIAPSGEVDGLQHESTLRLGILFSKLNHINSLPILGRPKSLGLHNWLLGAETQVSRGLVYLGTGSSKAPLKNYDVFHG